MFEDQEVVALSAIASTTNRAARPEETTWRAQQDPGSLSISPTEAFAGTTLVSAQDVTTEIAPGIDETPGGRTRSSRKSRKGAQRRMTPRSQTTWRPFLLRTTHWTHVFKEESSLTVVIAKLWNEHKTVRSIVSQKRKSAKWLRLDLQRQLHAYKKLLVGAGRDGQWAQFLRGVDIPLSTADRYVKNCERELELLESPAVEPSCEPTTEQIAALVKRLMPKLRKELRTYACAGLFLNELTTAPQCGCVQSQASHIACCRFAVGRCHTSLALDPRSYPPKPALSAGVRVYRPSITPGACQCEEVTGMPRQRVDPGSRRPHEVGVRGGGVLLRDLRRGGYSFDPAALADWPEHANRSP